MIIVYIVAYILCATSRSFGMFAGGFIVYSIGQTGLQVLGQVIVADITTSRARGLANGLVQLPFMIIPWLSAFIVDSALANIGWRWGIAMYAIILPVCSCAIIVPLFYYQHRVSKIDPTARRKHKQSLKSFCSQIDLGGMVLLTTGLAMVLIPIALAGKTSNSWSAPWVPTLLSIGVLLLVALVFYESRFATRPVVPPHYLRNASLVLSFIIGLLDAFAYSITHTYMYAWVTVSHNFRARDATFLTYTAGCLQVVTGLLTGWIMYRRRRYKNLLIIGVVIRLIGYGVMLRLRGTSNHIAELFAVQIVQGAGSGAVGTVVIVVAQVVVEKAQLAQATALVLLCIYLGNAMGSSTAGCIYTSMFKDRLRTHLGSQASQETINAAFDKITGSLPKMGTPERMAINLAVSLLVIELGISVDHCCSILTFSAT